MGTKRRGSVRVSRARGREQRTETDLCGIAEGYWISLDHCPGVHRDRQVAHTNRIDTITSAWTPSDHSAAEGLVSAYQIFLDSKFPSGNGQGLPLTQENDHAFLVIAEG